MKDYTAGKPWKIEKQQHIMETAFTLFSEKGIGQVTMPEIADASGVGRATLFRYFNSRLDLVVAIATSKWEEYINNRNSTVTREALEKMTGAEHLKFYMDGFIDLYHSHKDILRFNYDFNSFLRNEKGIPEQKQPYMKVVDELRKDFHVLYQKGMEDGTLNASISEETMFSSSFHIMLAAVTRYAIGLVYVLEQNTDPEIELVMLENLLLREFSRLN